MAGRIVIHLFSTLDGVAQAPGAPDEDTSGGFRFGGWEAPLSDEVVATVVWEDMADLDALLLGRRTHDIFAGFWPDHATGNYARIGGLLNRVPKYVATRTGDVAAWEKSTPLGNDLVAEIDVLRGRHEHVHVLGSLELVQTLLRDELFDELKLWVFPLLLGEGKKAFPEGVVPSTLRLLGPPVTSGQGAVRLRYAPGGEVRTGTF